MPYKQLNSDKIVSTLKTLKQRISERFSGASLEAVCAELIEISRQSRRRTAEIQTPILSLRIGVGIVLLVSLGALFYVGGLIEFKAGRENWLGVLSGIEALVNILIFMGAAGLFLVTFEDRVKRRRVLEDLHQLRSIVHVIDMHQLTKDPSAILKGGSRTEASPKREMNEFELTRYLDYCSEMLSLCAKVAALYAQNFRDPVVINTVTELEQLTTNLSHKIWQKIMILQRYDEAVGASGAVIETEVATKADPLTNAVRELRQQAESA